MAPFLIRPGYRPLPRPYDKKRATPMPSPPPAWPAECAGILFRAAQRLGITVHEADERLTVEDVLDEADLHAYLHDVDHEPETAPPVTQSAGRRR